jgi:hypothetical protein
MSGTMLPYIVRQGDYLTKLAFVHGFDEDEVWNDPKNEDLKKLRTDPNILAPGDILFIPEKEGEEGLPIAKGTENSYAATVPKAKVCVVFKEFDGKPMANEPYEVKGCVVEKDAKTDGDGRLMIEVAVSVREVEVLFPGRHLSFRVRVGDMDPAAENSGARQRLENLGMHPSFSGSDSTDDGVTQAAISAFQGAKGLPQTGVIDDATRDALVSTHGL